MLVCLLFGTSGAGGWRGGGLNKDRVYTNKPPCQHKGKLSAEDFKRNEDGLWIRKFVVEDERYVGVGGRGMEEGEEEEGGRRERRGGKGGGERGGGGRRRRWGGGGGGGIYSGQDC